MRQHFPRAAYCHPDRAHKGEWSGSPKPQEAVLGMMYTPDFFGRSVSARLFGIPPHITASYRIIRTPQNPAIPPLHKGILIDAFKVCNRT